MYRDYWIFICKERERHREKEGGRKKGRKRKNRILTHIYLTSYSKINSKHGTDNKTIKFVIENIKENLSRSQIKHMFFFLKNQLQNTQSMKEKLINLNSSILKYFALQKTLLRKLKASHTLQENNCKNIYVIKDRDVE